MPDWKNIEMHFFSLNEKLVAKQLVMEVKAIGGYAMLYNHLREGGFTVDVDTATKDYSPEIKELFFDVSVEQGSEEDSDNCRQKKYPVRYQIHCGI